MDSKILKDITNSRILDIIYQPTEGIISPSNMYVINFNKEGKLFSLHVFCSLRILLNNRILLTSCDEIINLKYELINSEIDSSLVEHNISNVKKMVEKSVVTVAEISECGDLIITLSNKMIIEVRPDCLLNMFEYYRLFEYADLNNKITVSCMNGNICIK